MKDRSSQLYTISIAMIIVGLIGELTAIGFLLGEKASLPASISILISGLMLISLGISFLSYSSKEKKHD